MANPQKSPAPKSPPLPAPLLFESTSQFDRDLKRESKKRGGNLRKLTNTIAVLRNRGPLPPRWREHSLKGIWKGFKECHIGGEGDWLLVYQRTAEKLILVRTGTHDEIFP